MPRTLTNEDYSGLAGGAKYTRLYEALAAIVPPSEVGWLPSVAVAVRDLVNAYPWLGRELRNYSSEFTKLPGLMDHPSFKPPDQLPTENMAGFPVQKALAITPTKDSWLAGPKALLIAVAIHQAQTSSSDHRALKGIEELSKFVGGLNYVNVRQSREAFLRAAEPETDALKYAQALWGYMDDPHSLPASSVVRSAKPSRSMLSVLSAHIIPFLEDQYSQAPLVADARNTESWERDDGDISGATIWLRSPPSRDLPADEADEETVEISLDYVPALGRVPQHQLEAFEDPFAEPPAGQAIHSANSLLLPYHADCLTAPEIQVLLPTIQAALDRAIAGKHARHVHALLTLSLMFGTGLTMERVAEILENHDRSDNSGPHLSSSCEELIMPVINPLKNPPAQGNNQDLVLDHAAYLRIPLPPSLAASLREYCENFPAGLECESDEIYSLLRSIADSAGLAAVTLGRLRRTAAPMLYQECRDLVAVMHLTGDTFGKPLAPIHYANFSVQVLRRIYRRAMWPLFKDDPEDDQAQDKQEERGEPSRIGSPFCPLQKSARKACSTVGASLHAGVPLPAQATLIEVDWVHNTMAAHLGAMLVSAVGHRPNSALFRLTVHGFDADYQLALFADKDIDPAHLTRLVALGQEVSGQLERYVRHLYGLLECTALPRETITKIRRVLRGQAPLLFALDEQGSLVNWSVESWKAMLPDQWRQLRPNFGRHYIATRGRELGYSPEWVHVHLGHLDVAGYPFSGDSPVYPIDLGVHVGPLIDEVFVEQGWKRRNGFAPASDMHSSDPWSETGPLRVTANHSERFREKLEKERTRFHEQLRAQLRPLKRAAEEALINKVGKVSEPLAEALCFRFNGQREKRGESQIVWPETTQKPPMSLTNLAPACLDQSMMESIRGMLEQEAGDDQAYQIALTNQLAYGIEWLRNRRKYTGPYCGAYRLRSRVDESPFYEGVFLATKQVRELRQIFRELKKSPYKNESPENSRWELGKAALAICIFGQVEDLSIAAALLCAPATLERIPASPVSLLVHLSEPETTIGLYGPAALAYSRWYRMYARPIASLEDAEQVLDAAIQAVLPVGCLRKGQGIRAVLQTMHIANRVELPGLHRTILDPEQGAVSLPPDRLRSLLDPTYRAKAKTTPTRQIKKWAYQRTQQISEIDAQVRLLRSLIPSPNKGLLLPKTGETIKPETRQYEPARNKLLEELRAWENDTENDLLVRCLAGWFGYLLRRPRKRGSGKLALSTVGEYFGHVALPLVKLVGRGGLAELSVEDLEDIYLDLLAATPEGSRDEACAQLLSFHDHLIEAHQFEPVDASNFRQFASNKTLRQAVSNQLVLPAERDLITHHLRQLAEPASQSGTHRTDIRGHTQALFCFALAAATGARINELAGLRHKDVILIGDEIALILRPNGYRRLKTPAARRVVDASRHLEAGVAERLARWIRAERERIGDDRYHNQLVFVDLQNELVGAAKLRSWYTPTMKAFNGEISTHHLRHTRVNEIFLHFLVGVDLAELHLSGRTSDQVTREPSMPRDLMMEITQMGHRRPRTSAVCYFHLPFAAGIAAQKRLHGDRDRSRDAAAMGISTSGLDNLVQRWEEDYIARFIDRSCKFRRASKKVKKLEDINLPTPIPSKLPRLATAVDLLAQGISVESVRETIGLTTLEVEMLLEKDREQAIDSGIALVRGNPNGNPRSSSYPRWGAGSRDLKSLWRLAEVEQDAGIRALARGWLQAATNRDNRAILRWDADLIKAARQSLENEPNITIELSSAGLLHDVSILCGERTFNHEMAYVLAVAVVVIATVDALGSRR